MQKYAFFAASLALVHGACGNPDATGRGPDVEISANRGAGVGPTDGPDDPGLGASLDSGVPAFAQEDGGDALSADSASGGGASPVSPDSGAGPGTDPPTDDGVDAPGGADDGVAGDDDEGDGSAPGGEPIPRHGSLCDARTVLFEDTFDSMDWSAWSMKCTGAMVRDAECRQENVSAQQGELQIRTRRIGDSNRYSSAGIVSQAGLLTAGRTVCIEARLPGAPGAGNGLWPALWFMPMRGECWPYGGEIDLLEMVDADGEVHNTYHYVAGHVNGVTPPTCDDLSNKRALQTTTRTWPGWYDRYHEYALRMTEDEIIYYLDGRETMRVRKGDEGAHIDTETSWQLQINTAVGGDWPKPVDASTVSDTSFRIRSVKVVESGDSGRRPPLECIKETVVDALQCGTTRLIDAAQCGTRFVTSVAQCGVEHITSAAQCGQRWITDAARCGTRTVTSAAACGVRTITSAAQCGVERVTDGLRCGWNIISAIFGLKEPKSCSVPKTCSIANTCDIANRCQVPASCDVARSCEIANECEIAKTCEVEICDLPGPGW